ncbi:SusC/RagA family TonB-linked outer membrane protein [Algivirga pacifica]|uniref:SusC/RagA family TonB-linked outer membrane protein n=1 Tax=Algivirga pacifica TaxID=1162670 RepID=A0ABP9DF11_9BACT
MVTGVVSDENGPLPGVTVVIKGTTNGTVTGIDGDYQLTIPEGDITLVYQFVGYKDKEVAVGNQSVIDVQMEADTKELDEVVVTAIGIERSERSLGYSVTAVDSEELVKTNETSALNSLQGKVAGINITRASGNPGASTKVRIRGLSSLTGNNQPLYVINGVPVSNSSLGSSDLNGSLDFGNALNDINPDDIVNISVLKGASATALYGLRGANGVIMITTKSGKDAALRRRKAEVTVNLGVTFDTPLKLPELQNRFGQGFNGEEDLSENTSWGPRFDGKLRLWGRQVGTQQKAKPFENLENNIRNFFGVGVQFNTSVSLGGGNDKVNYYASYSNVTSDGYIPSDKDIYQRNTFTFSGGAKLTNNLKSSASVSYINTEGRQVFGGQSQNSVFDNLYQTPRDIPVTELADLNDPFNTPENYYTPYGLINPYFVIEEYGNNYNQDRVFGNILLEYELLEGLSLQWRLGDDVINRRLEQWSPLLEIEGPNAAQSDPGQYQVTREYVNQINSDLIASYLWKISEDFSLNTIAGWNVNHRGSETLVTQINSLESPGFYDLSNSSDLPIATQINSQRRLQAIYASVDADFRNFLFLTAAARNEWSSTLPEDNRSFFYPSVNLSFLFSELIDNDLFTYGKVRLGYARSANDALPYQTETVFFPSGFTDGFTQLRFPLANTAAFSENNLAGNPNLKPELTDEFELGTELRFFTGRLYIDATYYNKTTSDVILAVPLPLSTGYSVQTRNAARVRNKGIELLVRGTPVETDNFNWTISWNFTRNRNEVLELTDGVEEVSLGGLSTIQFQAIPGQPMGVFKGQVPLRDDNGNIVVNESGRPIFEQNVILGDSQEDFITGLTNSFQWRGLTFDFTLDYRKGGLMYSRTADIMHFLGTTPETLYNDRRPFVIPGSVVNVNPDPNGEPQYEPNTVPIAQENNSLLTFWGDGGFEGDRAYLVKKDYVKLREINISYRLPSNWLNRTPFGMVSFGFVARNLFIVTPDSNIYVDPEMTSFASGSGVDAGSEFGEFTTTLPTRSMGGMLKFTF